MTPSRFPDRDEIAQVRAEAELLEPGVEGETERRLAGRVLGRRELGKLVFLDLVDRSGRIQLLCSAARCGEVNVHLGDLIGVAGKPTRSRRGEPSLQVDWIETLAPIRSPLPDTFHGLTDVEQRYRRRYVDLLMNSETREDFLVRSRMVSAMRHALDRRGFVEVETPILQPRYGGAFARPFRTHHNELDQTFYLRIATELYLKRLIVGGLERVYELGKDFRNEGVSYKHNPEFTMLEWYEAYADYRDTMDRMEKWSPRSPIGRSEAHGCASAATSSIWAPGSGSGSSRRSSRRGCGAATSSSSGRASRSEASRPPRTEPGRSSSIMLSATPSSRS